MLRYFTHWTTSRNGHSPLRESLRKTLSPRQSLSILWIPLIPSVWIRAISYRIKDYRKNYLGYTRRISALASPRPYMFRSYGFVSTLSLETCCYIPFNPSFSFFCVNRAQWLRVKPTKCTALTRCWSIPRYHSRLLCYPSPMDNHSPHVSECFICFTRSHFVTPSYYFNDTECKLLWYYVDAECKLL